MADCNQITGIRLHTEDNHTVIVSVEIRGQWREIIREHISDVGGAISHIAEPSVWGDGDD